MKKLSDEIIHFFMNQGYVVVSTIDENGYAHNACKGIVKIDKSGRIFLFDLYHAQTRKNLQNNPHITITAIEEHKFKGYCLKGKVELQPIEKLSQDIIKAWEDRITSRLTQRLLKNIKEEKGHPRHPEMLLPEPKYLIVMEVEEIVDLTPHHLK